MTPEPQPPNRGRYGRWREFLTPEEAAQYPPDTLYIRLPHVLKRKIQHRMREHAAKEFLEQNTELRTAEARMHKRAAQARRRLTLRAGGFFTAKQKVFIEGVARGLSAAAAAREAGFSPSRGQHLLRREDVLAAVNDRIAELALERADGAWKVLEGDAKTNVQFFMDVRGGKYAALDPSDLRTRLQAAIALLDRQLPKKVESRSEETITLRFDSEQLAVMALALREDAAPVVDITPGPAGAAPPPTDGPAAPAPPPATPQLVPPTPPPTTTPDPSPNTPTRELEME